MGKTLNRVLLPKAARGKEKALEAVKAFPLGSIGTLVGDDLKKQVGHPVQGLVIKSTEAKQVLEATKKALEEKKIENVQLTIAVSGKDLLFVSNGGSSWEKFSVLVTGYTDIIEQQKNGAPEGVVANLDPGDDVIDKASKTMEKKFGTTAVTKEGVGDKLVGMKTGEIVLLAHGDEDKTSSGQIYGKDFAGKSASWIVDLLTKNKDEKKRLSPEFSGTVYLDGCFTAQGGAMKNYALMVWNGLKAAGIPNVKVKGNLGAAATTSGGDEKVNPTIEKAECEKKINALWKPVEQGLNICDTRMRQIVGECNLNGTSPLENKEYKVLQEKKKQINQRYDMARKDILDRYPVDVINLVGKFGLQTIN